MRIVTKCDFVFHIQVPTPFLLMLRPRSSAHQWIISETYRIDPIVPVCEFTDGYGNLCQRLIAPPGKFTLNTTAEVVTADDIDRNPGGAFTEVQNLPDEILSYLLPSRYCESDRFGQMAMDITNECMIGYDQVAAIEKWIRDTINYEQNMSDLQVSAIDVNNRGWGVCRDMAHLGIALCRALSIPARMVVGYLYDLKPMSMHAWFEAFIGGRWYTFDPTQVELTGGYVAIGYGRDAADVAIYSQFGPALFPTMQHVSVEKLDD